MAVLTCRKVRAPPPLDRQEPSDSRRIRHNLRPGAGSSVRHNNRILPIHSVGLVRAPYNIGELIDVNKSSQVIRRTSLLSSEPQHSLLLLGSVDLVRPIRSSSSSSKGPSSQAVVCSVEEEACLVRITSNSNSSSSPYRVAVRVSSSFSCPGLIREFSIRWTASSATATEHWSIWRRWWRRIWRSAAATATRRAAPSKYIRRRPVWCQTCRYDPARWWTIWWLRIKHNYPATADSARRWTVWLYSRTAATDAANQQRLRYWWTLWETSPADAWDINVNRSATGRVWELDVWS